MSVKIDDFKLRKNANGKYAIFDDGNVTVDRLLDVVDMKLDWYVPSDDAIKFMIFLRLVLGEEPENSNPKTHYFMIDCIFKSPNVKPYFDERGIDFDRLNKKIVVLCSREFSKSVLISFLMLFMADEGRVPGFGRVNYGVYVSDSMRNGVKNTFNTLEKVYLASKYLRSRFEHARFTDSEMNLTRKPRSKKEIELWEKHVVQEGNKPDTMPDRMKRTFSVKGVGAEAIPLTATLFTEYGKTTMGECKIGDYIYGADGKLCRIKNKSDIFYKDMYRIHLEDGRSIDVTDDHLNTVVQKTIPSARTGMKTLYDRINWTTTELLEKKLFHTRVRNGKIHKERLLFIENCGSLERRARDFIVDPYTLGVFLGDGTIKKDKKSARITCHEKDLETYRKHIPYEFGEIQTDTRNKNIKTFTILGVGSYIYHLGLSVNSSEKFIPEEYMYGSEEQRLDLLRGLIDTDGTVNKDRGKARYSTTSKRLAEDVSSLVRSLGGRASISCTANSGKTKIINGKNVDSIKDTYLVYIWLNMPLAKLERKLKLQTHHASTYGKYVAIVDIEKIPMVPSQCIAVENDEHQFITGDYVRTHNTGTRGTREALDRPQFAIFDDLVAGEQDADSDTILASIESTIDSDVLKGLSGNGHFAILIGTPYNKKDPVYKRIEEGTWLPVVFPRAREMYEGIKEEDFVSVWPDRHKYANCVRDFEDAMMAKNKGNGMPMRKLMQEYYLRISNDEDRMISDKMINWYSRAKLMAKLEQYNLYMTTDFTTTGNSGSDLSGTALWALGSNSDWFLLDLSLRKKELTEQYDDVFVMVNTWSRYNYRGITVGVEVDGGQRAHIQALKDRMVQKNTWFTIGKQRDSKPGSEGIMSRLEGGNKHWRFRLALPLFQNHKIWFPEELRETPDMKELMEEIEYATYTSFGSRYDDGADLISMLIPLDTTTPPAVFDEEELDSVPLKKRHGMWAHHDMQYGDSDDNGAYSTYM